jgi:hypothetical protein
LGPSQGKPGHATCGAASDGFLQGGAAGERDYRNNLHRAASSIKPCHNEAGFRNGPTAYLSVTDWLLLIHTARGHERESCGNDKCERLHQHFPRRAKYLGQFLTDGESLARSP